MYRNTYVEINLDNIKRNIENITKYYNNYTYYFGVVKGNAYGHGNYVVNTMIESGINYLAVSSLEEALNVRKWNKDIPILSLQPISLEFINVCLENNITITVHDYDYFKKLSEIDLMQQLKFHLKLDTGMNRLGVNNEEQVKKIYDASRENKNIFFEGIYTHMGTSGMNDKFWDNQLKAFIDLTKSINLNEIPIVHIDRSLTMMCHDKISFCNGVRIGITMYGYNQIPIKGHGWEARLRDIKNNLRRRILSISPIIDNHLIELKPALSLYSDIIQIKRVKKNKFVGYGISYKTKNNMLVATIPIGYADGVNLKNSGRDVIINNKRYPIIGSVNMGMISVAIDDSVKLGDRVTIIGEGISIREVSRYLNTTIYEVMATICTSVPRVYIENKKVIYTEEF